MKKRQYQLYEKEHRLEYRKENFDLFYKRWKNKFENYKGDSLNDLFDLFFSRFVLYNSLYNIITMTLEENNEIPQSKSKDGRGDKEKAIEVMSCFLDKDLLNLFFEEEEVGKCISSLHQILERKSFKIIFSRNRKWNEPAEDLVLTQLNGNNPDRIKAVLTVLYHLRCNMFHGTKDFTERQRELLNPLNQISLKVIELSYQSFENLILKLLSNIRDEIKKEESDIKA